MSAGGKGDRSVRATKRGRLSDGEPWQKLELFPTPPWATRALIEHVFPRVCATPDGLAAHDPAAGLGHMSAVLEEYFIRVEASDVYCYPLDGGGDTEMFGIKRCDYLDIASDAPRVDWVITNPPFSPAAQFLTLAVREARRGVALLLRMQWLEGRTRYAEIFAPRPPALIAPFVERVPMCEGGFDPDGNTATMYAWFVWARNLAGCYRGRLEGDDVIPIFLIPPGQREALTKPSDARLAARCVPGFIPPSRLKKCGREQLEAFA